MSGDFNRDSQERIERKARTKRGSKIVDVRVSLSAAQMNPDTDFSVNQIFIDICFLAVTAWFIDYPVQSDPRRYDSHVMCT